MFTTDESPRTCDKTTTGFSGFPPDCQYRFNVLQYNYWHMGFRTSHAFFQWPERFCMFKLILYHKIKRIQMFNFFQKSGLVWHLFFYKQKYIYFHPTINNRNLIAYATFSSKTLSLSISATLVAENSDAQHIRNVDQSTSSSALRLIGIALGTLLLHQNTLISRFKTPIASLVFVLVVLELAIFEHNPKETYADLFFKYIFSISEYCFYCGYGKVFEKCCYFTIINLDRRCF